MSGSNRSFAESMSYSSGRKSYGSSRRSVGSGYSAGSGSYSSKSSASGATAAVYQRIFRGSSFLSLFRKRKWAKVLRLLNSKNATKLCREKDISGISTLAMSLGYDAPLEIVQLILQIDPALAIEKDTFGASSLHIACLNGAPIESITYLLQCFPSLATSLDCDLRTPLHHAVEYVIRMDREEAYEKEDILDAVKALCKIAPETIHASDKHDDSPLDLTQIVLGDLHSSSYSEDESQAQRVDYMYQYLKAVSIQVYLQKKSQWELQGFDTTKDIAKKEDDMDIVKANEDEENTATTMSAESSTDKSMVCSEHMGFIKCGS